MNCDVAWPTSISTSPQCRHLVFENPTPLDIDFDEVKKELDASPISKCPVL
jgi:hypothetical protein